MGSCFECFCFIMAIPDLSWLEKASTAATFLFFINSHYRAHHVFYKYSCPGTTSAFNVCGPVVYRVVFFYVEATIEESCELELFFIYTNIVVEKFRIEELVARS